MEYESEFTGGSGLHFFVRGWEPTAAPRAVAALVHGQGEHTGRYAHVGARFAEAGFALMGFDLRGHGKSDGPRGHSPNYEALMKDIDDFLAQVEERYPDIPRFLYGHSAGGNLVLNYALRRKPDLLGVIATGPWLRLAFQPPAFQLFMAGVLNRIFPALKQNAGLNYEVLTHDADIVAAAGEDPLNHGTITVRHFFDMHESGLWALEHASEFPLPLLLMHGAADQVTSEAASREFAERAGNRVTYRAWEGLYHEIHNEPNRAEVLRVMTDWMTDRLEGRGGEARAESRSDGAEG